MSHQDELQTAFKLHEHLFTSHPYLPLARRLKNLQQLKKLMQINALSLSAAVNKDYGYRAQEETLLLEIYPTINAINYCIKHLKKWIRPRKRKIDWYFGTGKGFILAQPLGTIGIVSPWNYPIYLSLVPLAYALAAGNQVMIKISELTPVTGQKLKDLIEQSDDLKEAVSIHNGDAAFAEQFTSLPFAHLLFTGSTKIGQKVMAAASKNLTPLTLELGGKSPTIISSTASMHFLDRILMGKLFNAGQTCLAPDYLLIDEKWEDHIGSLVAKFMQKRYSEMSNKHYSNIISTNHKQRLSNLLDDARLKGARIVQFGNFDEEQKMPFYLVFNVNPTMQIMQEEIFGPILPIMIYNTFSQVIDYISSLTDPLAIYYFGNNNEEIRKLQCETLSGALAINDTVMQVAMDDLPFGGVGQSGIGRYHSQEGFDTFSNLKSVFKQGRLSSITFLYPPYGKLLYYFLRYWAGIRIRNDDLH
ncbi:aldehyde dehydrogenase family protein [Legionella sp. D16C41]|uniref:aldehyde dehydrogenase family protein n=1 Tax=Legionella sp. D16C41 TaxID=3402688 RepID=UPI003AF815D3